MFFLLVEDNILCVLLYLHYFQMIKQNVSLLIKKSKYGFGASTDTFASYFFQLIVLLKPDLVF